LDHGVVPTRLDTAAFAWIRLDLPEASGHRIQVIRDHHDLAIGDADEFVSIGRLRIAPGFRVDLVGKFPIDYLHRFGGRHGFFLLWHGRHRLRLSGYQGQQSTFQLKMTRIAIVFYRLKQFPVSP
jgi:hypothetical protein